MTQPAAPTSKLAIFAIVASFLFPVLGLILGLLALREIRHSPTPLEGRGLAVASLVISAAGMFLGLFALISVFGILSYW